MTSTVSSLLANQVEQIGRYRLLEEIGRGATGRVYRAVDGIIERVVALKVVARPGPQSAAEEHQAYARFLREARAAGRFSHPNVVSIYDVGEDASVGISYIAMELIQGEALDRVLARKQRLDFGLIRAIGAQVGMALDAAHHDGVVHRDIKPANLILNHVGQVKVTDFGIAKIGNTSMTLDGSVLGSPSYMSPEQARSIEVDARSDIFSLGAVLYELCTLRPAFPGKTIIEVITRVATCEVVPPRQIRSDIPEDLENVILKALAKNKDERFQTALELAEALATPAAPTPVEHAPAAAPSVTAITAPSVPLEASEAEAGLAANFARTISRQPAAPVAPAIAALEPTTEVKPSFDTMLVPGSDEPTPADAATPAAASRLPLVKKAWLAVAAFAAAVAIVAIVRHSGSSAATPEVAVATPAAAASTPAPLPTATPAPKPAKTKVQATPRPQPKPQAMPAPTVAPPVMATPAAPPTPSPATGRRLIREAAVAHQHRFDECKGVLRVWSDHLEYTSADHAKDDRSWSYDKLHKFKYERRELEFSDGDKRYRFHMSQGDLEAPAVEALREHIAG